MADDWKDLVVETIDSNKEELIAVSSKLWENPEPSFVEFKAHELLTSFLEEEGFEVEKNYIVPTGFRATFQRYCDEDQADAHPTPLNVCFPCEYDAAVGIGHSAGHNLTSEAGIAAALAVKRCLDEQKFYGMVTVLGTPGEDSGHGAKIDMIRAGTFMSVDFAMMLWPLNNNLVFPVHFTLVTVTVTYKGKAAHASAFPWEGRNALDAAIACYSNIALLRQQLKPTWMINGIIKNGGTSPNTIPAESQVQFWLRAPEQRDIVFLQQKCTACFVAAAKATGCEVKFDFCDKIYSTMQHSEKLGEMYAQNAKELGMSFVDLTPDGGHHIGSTDMGNVSHVVPSLTPAFDIGTRAFKNSLAFTEAANQPEAHENTLRAAKAMALTAAQLLRNPTLIEAIKEEYVMVRSQSGTILTQSRSRVSSFSSVTSHS